MKSYTVHAWALVCAMTVTGSVALNSSADQAPMSAHPEKSYTGKITSVDSAGKLLDVKGVLFHKRFNLGDTCTYMLPSNTPGTLADLRPGEKVRVAYENAHGVLIADGITQTAMRFRGVVQSVDPHQHLMIVRHRMLDKKFRLADSCTVVLHDDKPGTVANVQPGEQVTVTFETPAGHATAREIAQTSATFTGELTALDLSERTLKAKTLLGTKNFELAHGCAIVLNGKPNGHLRDLKPGAKLTVSYDEVNGVCVANRIAEGATSPEATPAQTAMSH